MLFVMAAIHDNTPYLHATTQQILSKIVLLSILIFYKKLNALLSYMLYVIDSNTTIDTE